MTATEIRFTKTADGERWFFTDDRGFYLDGRSGSYIVAEWEGVTRPEQHGTKAICSHFLKTMADVREYVQARIDRVESYESAATPASHADIAIKNEDGSMVVGGMSDAGRAWLAMVFRNWTFQPNGTIWMGDTPTNRASLIEGATANDLTVWEV